MEKRKKINIKYERLYQPSTKNHTSWSDYIYHEININ